MGVLGVNEHEWENAKGKDGGSKHKPFGSTQNKGMGTRRGLDFEEIQDNSRNFEKGKGLFLRKFVFTE